MSRSYSIVKNKNQKHPKPYFEKYLYDANEPAEVMYAHSHTKLDSEMIEEDYGIFRQAKRMAHRLRNRYV